jgi:hypothetical protein
MRRNLVYNFYINTEERNRQLTGGLIQRIVDDVLQRDVRLFKNVGEKKLDIFEAGISNDEKITRFLLKAMKTVDTRNLTCLLPHQWEEGQCASTDHVANILDKLFDPRKCTWEFIVCLFAALDAIVYEAFIYSIRYGYKETYIANANSRLVPCLGDVLSVIEKWILHNNGWMALIDNFNPLKVDTENIVKDIASAIANM